MQGQVQLLPEGICWILREGQQECDYAVAPATAEGGCVIVNAYLETTIRDLRTAEIQQQPPTVLKTDCRNELKKKKKKKGSCASRPEYKSGIPFTLDLSLNVYVFHLVII